jgi:hypothetical protein
VGKKVFISHASADNQLVGILLEYLNSVGIANEDIFCTSISGSLEGGINFVKQIKSNVRGSKVVIFLLSERFFLSYFCLAELGAAWAQNQHILPIIVPPISTEEFNKTPLIGIQALNMGSANFANELFNDLVRKSVIENAAIDDIESVFNMFNAKVKAETAILRADAKGFYAARLIEVQTRQVAHQKQMPCHAMLGAPCNYTVLESESLHRLNGLLEIEADTRIAEHWIQIKAVHLSSSKLLFQIREPIEQVNGQRLYSVKIFYELP